MKYDNKATYFMGNRKNTVRSEIILDRNISKKVSHFKHLESEFTFEWESEIHLGNTETSNIEPDMRHI